MPFAVITGATQGIGRAIAEKLLQEDWDIAICARSSDDLQQLQKEWEKAYPDCAVLVHTADLSRKEEVYSFAQVILDKGFHIDVLVNNAGLYFPGSLATEADGHLETLMAVNVYSAYHLTRLLLPSMKERKAGHIFNLCSVASLQAYPGGGSYGITKYALLGFSDNLREELKPHGIKVTAIAPGATWSRSWSHSGVAEERLMKAEDIANMIWAAYSLSAQADVEMIVMRPSLGDL